MKVLSANILLNILSPKIYPWEKRKRFCLNTLCTHRYDIICLQEASTQQVQDISQQFPAHTVVDHATQQHPLNTVLLQTKTCRVKHAYALSLDTGSEGLGKKLERYANIIVLQYIPKNIDIILINTHLSYNHIALNLSQVQQIHTHLMHTYPMHSKMIFSGDFNCVTSDNTYTFLTNSGWIDSYYHTHNVQYPGITYHGFGKTNNGATVDFIFVKNLADHLAYTSVLDTTQPKKYGSDHFFIDAHFDF